MADVDPIERIGGSSRFVTLITMVIHFVHPLLCVANYLDWVRHQSGDDALGNKLVVAYLAMTIIAVLFYLLVSSVFYMWAWRYPEPEEIAKRRRIYGIVTNLLFSDFPIFLVEVQIVWSVGFATGLQGTCFVFTCISLLYSGLRVWTFVMVKVIKVQAPIVGAQPNLAGVRNFDGGYGRGNAMPQFQQAGYGDGYGQEMRVGGIIPNSPGQYSPARGQYGQQQFGQQGNYGPSPYRR